MTDHFYPVGTAGKVWGDAEREQWLALVGTAKRSYADEVLNKLEPLKSTFDVDQYGQFSSTYRSRVVVAYNSSEC